MAQRISVALFGVALAFFSGFHQVTAADFSRDIQPLLASDVCVPWMNAGSWFAIRLSRPQLRNLIVDIGLSCRVTLMRVNFITVTSRTPISKCLEGPRLTGGFDRAGSMAHSGKTLGFRPPNPDIPV